MDLSVFWQFVGWFSLPVLAILAGALAWRKAYREFPFFFYYIIAAEAVGLGRLFVYYYLSRSAYAYTYWVSDALITLFALLTTYELFLRRLFPRFHKTRFYRGLFPLAAVLLSILTAPIALQTNQLHRLLVTLHVLDFLRVAILLFFVGLMLAMGRHWSRSEFAIALGLAVQAAVLLTTFAIWTKNPDIHGLVDQLPTIAYDVACLIWLVTFLRPEQATPVLTAAVSPEILDQARKWEETLKESVTGKKGPL
ncbi:MAG TPA: hypothetical protein VKY85_06540 [Candidatus Angelobacter sp.]|nr:hypothetical protein [Candidatus Angelobacter sp.]